ncbi:MAG TPA: hypothetical protein VIY47_17110, partial [Ignavibacteriaceae bacterium]
SKEITMKPIKVPVTPPRNPLVALVKARGGGGVHQKTEKALRRQDKMSVQKALKGDWKDSFQSPFSLDVWYFYESIKDSHIFSSI